MSLHVIVGAGPVGTATARLLAERGERVRMVTRRGNGPEHAAIERIAADATDAARLSALTAGAVALYDCANPLYYRWLTDWPPLASALLAAAERSGAVLATVSNLYGYGPVDAPIKAATPLAATHPKLRLRAQMWRDALAAHQAGRIRATEVRGQRLHRGQLGLQLRPRRTAVFGQAGVRAGGPRRPTQLDVDCRRGADPGHGGDAGTGLGTSVAGADQPGVDGPRAGHPVHHAQGPGAPEADSGAVPGALGGRPVLPDDARAASHPLPVDSAVRAGLHAHRADFRLDAHADRHGPGGHLRHGSGHKTTLTIRSGTTIVLRSRRPYDDHNR